MAGFSHAFRTSIAFSTLRKNCFCDAAPTVSAFRPVSPPSHRTRPARPAVTPPSVQPLQGLLDPLLRFRLGFRRGFDLWCRALAWLRPAQPPPFVNNWHLAFPKKETAFFASTTASTLWHAYLRTSRGSCNWPHTEFISLQDPTYGVHCDQRHTVIPRGLNCTMWVLDVP